MSTPGRRRDAAKSAAWMQFLRPSYSQFNKFMPTFRANRVLPFFYPSIEPKLVVFEVVMTAPSEYEPKPKGSSSASSPTRDGVGSKSWSSCCRFFSEAFDPNSAGQTQRGHVVVQPAHPTIGHRRGDHAARLALGAELDCQPSPARLTSNQTMRRFDQHCSQLRVAGLDQSRIRLAFAAGSVARAQATKTAQLFASAEAVEATDLGDRVTAVIKPTPRSFRSCCTTASSLVTSANRFSTARIWPSTNSREVR